ncbi:hypothetical protein KP509_09G062300 [Ceratopteris richardii]|nr:hypothetical protein KP509_09G062300 [Ceratopteris richardii]
MQQSGFAPNAVTYVCSLKACGSIGWLEKGQDIHTELEKKGLLKGHIFIGGALLDMYSRCGSLLAAKKVLETLPSRNVVMWNILIDGYTENGFSRDALGFLDQMHQEGISSDIVTFMLTLKACGRIGEANIGQELHAEIERMGLLNADINIGNTLVDMYIKCGLLELAHEVFDKLPTKDVVSWTALIVGYSEQGYGVQAIKLYDQMQGEDISPNNVTLVCGLRACSTFKAIDKGEQLHAYILRHDMLERDLVLYNSLIDMYVKCGLVLKAQELFNELHEKNVISWNILLSGYCEHGQNEKVLDGLVEMQKEGILPTPVTFICNLKATSTLVSIDDCRRIHKEIEKRGFLYSDLVGNSVVDTYAKCGFLSEAHQVFEKLPLKDTVTWSSLINGYSGNGYYREALELVKQMQLEGFPFDSATLLCSLKSCASLGDAEMGQKLHVEVERQGLLEENVLVGSTLVDMYSKFGVFSEAQQVFDKMLLRNEVTWNAFISGLAAHGHGEKALQYLQHMEYEGVFPDAVTFISSLVACASTGAIEIGQKLHAEAERGGLVQSDLSLGNAIVDFYIKCSCFTMAKQVFDKLPTKNLVTWNIFITGCVECSHGEAALQYLELMQSEGIIPDELSYLCSTKACCIVGLEKGLQIHSEIERRGFLEKGILGSALINMYCELSLLTRARDVFDKLPALNVASWNALIAGYAKHGHGDEAIKYLEQMEVNGISPDAITMLCSLKACGIVGASCKGQLLHTNIERVGLLETDCFVGNTLVSMYASCGSLTRAQQVFNVLKHRDVVTWNALMLAYVKHGLGEEAIECIDRMYLEGIYPSPVTYICTLKACGSIGAWDIAADIHGEIERQGLLETDPYLGNTLIDLYASGGMILKAQEVFDRLSSQGVVAWTALMKGYALLSDTKRVLRVYDKMLHQNIKPDPITFIVILNACAHSCSYTKTQTFFDSMNERQGIVPNLERYNCMVSPTSHTGKPEESLSLIKRMLISSNLDTRTTVLGDCMRFGNIELAEQVFECASY